MQNVWNGLVSFLRKHVTLERCIDVWIQGVTDDTWLPPAYECGFEKCITYSGGLRKAFIVDEHCSDYWPQKV